ncbi:hypothetical protein TWF103_005498 [Orbilia oligospora]|uniref:Uncharacterized protein n=1 Tax=Orbilia oligospora TaxID=2813651 RepID=A0A7C8JRZ4_ORBOL|nr:hypothetical protein TWF103_005498 [Orbilia oligospora]KAF3121765.1 hypothetical protein TWF703_001634 [Orbilia oligospora]
MGVADCVVPLTVTKLPQVALTVTKLPQVAQMPMLTCSIAATLLRVDHATTVSRRTVFIVQAS